MKLILLHILLRDCGTKSENALLASVNYTKFRDIIETEGLVLYSSCIIQEQQDNLNSKWAEI